MIPDAKIAEIRERSDIAEVVGDYVTLRRAGVNFKGVCPFHGDTDPSFNVNPAKQFFYCFGCGASGDIFSFVQRVEGLDFVDAAQKIASRFGIELPELHASPVARDRQQRERDASKRRKYVLEQAAVFFEETLWSESGKVAQEHLRERGVTQDVARRYRLGYAPDAWSALIDHLARFKISPKELLEVGLVLPNQRGSFYDRFRHRLVFTITEASGHPIAFSGRTLAADDDGAGAKYINSPETPEFTKGKTLFGLFQARVPISKAQEAVLVEGNFDVIAMAQAGVENVVAPLGTALTVDQAQLLRRRVESVVVVFDGDDAGRKAAARAFPILADAGLAAYTVALPQGEDPDSFARNHGGDALRGLIEKRVGLLDRIIDDAAAASDGSVQDAARRVEKLRPFLKALQTPMERDLYLNKIASVFGIDRGTVFRFMRGAKTVETAKKSAPAAGPPGNIEERELIGLLLDFPSLVSQFDIKTILPLVATEDLRTLLDEIITDSERAELSCADLIGRLESDSLRHWLAARAMSNLYKDEEHAKRALFDIGNKLKKTTLRNEIKCLEEKIYLANARGDDNEVLLLSREKANLQKENERIFEQLFDAGVAKA